MRRTSRTLIWAVVAVSALAWVVAPGGSHGVASAADPDPVELNGVGTWAAAGPALSWANELYRAPSPVRVGFLSEGSADARRTFMNGETEFLVSGTPFTSAELTELDAADRELIDLPIQAVGMAFIVSGPYPRGLSMCRPGPGEDDPSVIDCYPEGKFQGPLRLNGEDVVDIVLETGRNNWANSAFQDLMPPALDLVVPLQPAAPVVRSDAGSTNKFLQQYIATVDPARWAAKTAAEGRPGLLPDETWPFLGTPSKSGLPTVTQVVAAWTAPSSSSSVVGGVLAPTSPLAAGAALAAEASKPAGATRTDLWVPELRNGAGEWVAPTPAAITAGIQAGEGAPLYGLTNPVPGAWPITWVNRLYAPTTGLTGDQANALATMIRWQVTAGRDVAASLGDGRLTDAMATEALAKADEIVKSNCAAAKLPTAKRSAAGTHAPPGSLTGIGDVEVCVTGTAAPTPTDPTAAPEDPPLYGDDLGYYDGIFYDYYTDDFSPDSGSFDPISEIYPTDGGAEVLDESALGASSGAVDAAAIAASGSMPLPLPGDDFRELDRLSTLALGALLFLFGRSLLRRRTGGVA